VIGMDELTRRALAAYFRTAGGNAEQPESGSGVTELDGLTYVVLRNVNGILAVYRVRPAGLLKRLKRWPPALEEA
jgi:hypothetical protein